MKRLTKQEILISKKFIRSKSQGLEFYKCYANEGWFDSDNITSVFVSKIMRSGKICYAGYLIDKGCLGLKSTHCGINMSEHEFEKFIKERSMREERPFVEISPETAHNIIFGGIDYAESLGFAPLDKDWDITKHFLDEDLITDEIDEIEFGSNGKPLYIAGPYDNVKRILATLNKNVGEGNYIYLIMGK